MSENISERLEYLRSQLRAECISYGELAELQDLTEHIEAGDMELLEAAGVPEAVANGPIIRDVYLYLVGNDEGEARNSLIFTDPGEARDYMREVAQGADIFEVRAAIHFRTMKKL